MSFTTHTKAVLFATFSILIHGLSSSLPIYAYFKGSPIEVTLNQVNRSSESLSDLKQRERYLASTLETEIEKHFDAGDRNFELGKYRQATYDYGRAIGGLRSIFMYDNRIPERLRPVLANLASCHENRSMAYMKLYSAFNITDDKDEALKDLGEAARYYHLANDRANVVETIQKIRRIWGNKEANRYERWYLK